ncbi:Sec-independent protein translocase protein tatA/E-like protein [Thiorhodococcus drewsii AZ1]|uniref:Sec-independent protein translocase protein TatA n=1 Tax=Thiorhodococcus drewsii AZ1 TaxID=765913 RepID=G2E213_9GAMM|nr:twin-arginine translocase TatA/TatE family subunit [Thiorhodococcus drewsii]EGV30962.1 Sec-independent protein translocase protein tatA/E-like protein [Thiorhodococcus drewsii AZ1]
MGFGGISIWQLLIVLVILLLLFGTKRLKNVGSDLGDAIKGFRRSMAREDDESDAPSTPDPLEQGTARRTDQSGPGTQSTRENDRDRT